MARLTDSGDKWYFRRMSVFFTVGVFSALLVYLLVFSKRDNATAVDSLISGIVWIVGTYVAVAEAGDRVKRYVELKGHGRVDNPDGE